MDEPASTRPGDPDPVLRSVAAYSADPRGYAQRYEHRMLDRPIRFARSLPVPARILDLGCGPGRDLRIFAEHGHHPTGLELNPDFVDLARRHGPVVGGDLRAVGRILAGSEFDGIWAQASLVHLSTNEMIDVLAQLHDLLRPGGRLFACVSSTGSTGWLDEPDGRRWYTVWPPADFADAVTGAGFAVDEVRPGPYVEVWATRP